MVRIHSGKLLSFISLNEYSTLYRKKKDCDLFVICRWEAFPFIKKCVILNNCDIEVVLYFEKER